MADDRIKARGVECVGHLSAGVAPRRARGRVSDGVDSDGEPGERHGEAEVTVVRKGVPNEGEEVVRGDEAVQKVKKSGGQNKNREKASPAKEPVALSFQFVVEGHDRIVQRKVAGVRSGKRTDSGTRSEKERGTP